MPEYYVFNKPAGCVTARIDATHRTVTEYLAPELRERLHPVGRLDLDTEGMLIFTDDGYFDRLIINPESHIEKSYFFHAFERATGAFDEGCVKLLESGASLFGSDIPARPAKVTVVGHTTVAEIAPLIHSPKKPKYLRNPGGSVVSGVIRITEGKKHEVKLLLKSVGCHVCYLKRIAIGDLTLDPALPPGSYRPLTPREITLLTGGTGVRGLTAHGAAKEAWQEL